MYIKRNHLISSAAVIVLLLFMFSGALITTADAKDKDKDYEESAHTVLDSDEVVTGITDDFSKKSIDVNGSRYNFCKDIMVYNTSNRLIPFNVKDLEAALEVKLFRKKTCIRKIVILKYAE